MLETRPSGGGDGRVASGYETRKPVKGCEGLEEGGEWERGEEM